MSTDDSFDQKDVLRKLHAVRWFRALDEDELMVLFKHCNRNIYTRCELW